jgi:OPA family glycerol-3-phosphate transporter-like MFS transporter/OPA family sugar phosphate sensor protein UhpC-like MFS transporter
LEGQSPSDAAARSEVSPAVAHPSRGGWLRIFQPAPPAAVMLTDPKEIATKYRTWQTRVLLASIIAYATFYFVRKNLSIAMPYMEKDGIDKTHLGLFLTMHGLLYGTSKFANGFLADRSSSRAFLTVGLVASALMNILFGFSSAVVTLGIIWMLNGWFQGMGFPPCARLTANWFPPKQLATKFSIWNSSHCIGMGLILLLCSNLVYFGFGWRSCFFVPAGIALLCAVFIWLNTPDTPPSVGLPEVEGTHARGTQEQSRAEFRAFVIERVFKNPYIWVVSIANFFVYTIRFAVLDWGPTMLMQAKHIEIRHAAGMVVAFEACGLMGALIGGRLTDRWLGGRAARMCLIYMILVGISVLVFWKVPVKSELLTTAMLSAVGFFIYGPQCLLAVTAANLATKRAAGTAVGLTSIFGYASTVLSGWGLGKLVQVHGWDAAFWVLIVAAIIGTLLFAAAWPAKAHGYAD